MSDYVRVPKADWISILDATREKTGSSDPMVSGEVAGKIANIKAGGGEDANEWQTAHAFLGTILESVAMKGLDVSISESEVPRYYLYNGDRLPRMPDSVIVDYPNAFITNYLGKYTLFMANRVAYHANGNIYQKAAEQYICSADTNYAEWVYSKSGDVARIGTYLHWANHGIRNGSETATAIYFNGTEPVPTD